MKKFPALIDIHLHSMYSLLDGVNTPLEIAQKAKSFGANAVALTEHGSLASMYEFYDACKKEGIKPIIGCELYMKEKLQDGNKNLKYLHGIFLAMNKEGLKNLTKLSSLGGRPDHFEFNRPVVSFEDVFKYSDGIIYSTGCMDGILGASHDIPYEQVEKWFNQFKDVFKDRMYVEISCATVNTNWDSKERVFKPIEVKEYTFGESKCTTNCLQERHNRRALYMALMNNVPLALGTDGHLIDKSLKPVQDLLIKSSPTNHNGWHFGQAHYQMHSEEMWAQFQKNHPYIPIQAFEFALNNNAKLADRIEDYGLNFSTIVPKFPKENHPYYKEGMTSKELMISIIAKSGRLPNDAVYMDRLREEIKVICDNGVTDYTDYFLILHDIVRYAKENGVSVGPARGSVGGCLLSYLLGITAIDPIKYNLNFTRFLNEGRLKAGHPPDIDLDLSNRDPIVDYLFKTYGEDYMAMVGTFQTIKTKAALKDIVRHIKYDGKLPNYDEIHKITANIETAPQLYPSEIAFLEGFIDDDGVHHEGHLQKNEQLRLYLDNNKAIGNPPVNMFELLKKILAKPRYMSKHAGGVVIVPEPIDGLIPTRYYNDKKCTQIDHRTLEKIGGMKIDILGINTLNFISDAIKLVKERHGVEIDSWNLPEDPAVFEMISRGETATVFQFDTPTVRPFLKAIKPKCIDDLALITAVARPGGLDSRLSDGHTVASHFKWRKMGQESVSYIDPILKPILSETFGLCLFQEEIQKIFEVVGGLTPVESDDARRAIGKKDLKLLMSIKGQLFENATKKLGWSLEKCEALWESFIGAANYSFNKSHAVAYALLGYTCAYIKCHYPLEWWCAVLTHLDLDKMKQYLPIIKDALILPNINTANKIWTILDKNLVAPLTLVRGIGENTIEEIQRVRVNGEFKSFEDFFKRVNKTKVNRASILNMIVAGCFDGLPFNEGGIMVADSNIHELIDYFFKLRKNPKDEIPSEYQGLSDRLKKLSLRSILLSLVSYNYVNEFIDVIKAHFQYSDCGCHMIAGEKIVEDFENILFEDVGVVAVGLVVKSDLQYYDDKKTHKKKPYLKVSIENNRKLIKTIIWSDKLNDAIKADLKVGNLVAVHGMTKRSRYSGLIDELSYVSHAKLLTGNGEILDLENGK